MNIFVLFFFLTVLSAQYSIENYSIVFQDSSRSNRDILTEIYYPSFFQGESTTTAIGQFPIIIFGHGSAISTNAYQNLWQEFVPRGYIMIFPTTEGGIISNHQQFGWDLQFLVTKIQYEGNNSSSPIYNIVANNTALMGHSMGGGATFLAGDSLCLNNNNQLKTIIGLAPAESFSNGVSSISSAGNITIPSLILSGSQDGVTPPGVHHLPIYNNLASNYKTFISISGGAHCYFGNSNFVCDFLENASSSGISITRDEQQKATFDFLNSWLDYSLKDNCEQYSVFQDSIISSNRITYDQVHVENPTPSIVENNGALTSTAIGIEYQWFLNDSAIEGENNIILIPVLSGDYSVEVFFSNGCPTISNPYSFNYQLDKDPELPPISYLLHQNYPNPFNPITTVRYSLPKDDFVNITIYDITGNIVKTLVNSAQASGYKSIQWKGTNDRNEFVSGGVYIYTIQAEMFRQTKKMVLLK